MERYKITKTLGDGAFGSVYKAVVKGSNEVVAIKRMKKKFYSWEECLELREIKVLRKVTHPNVVKLKEVIRANDDLHLVFEFCERNLVQLATEQGSPFTDSQVKDITSQILNGLSVIHKNGFFHRDMKPDNILVSEGIFKIADYGLAKEIRSQPPYTDYVATRWYRAPEILLHSRRYNWQVDMFAVGCIMAELYMMRPLFPGTNEVDQLNRICSVLGTPNDWSEGQRLATQLSYCFPQYIPMPLHELMPNASHDSIKLMQSLLEWDPSMRLTADQCLQHSFFDDSGRFQNSNFLSVETKASKYHSHSADAPHTLSDGHHTRSGILSGISEVRNQANPSTSRTKLGGGSLGQFGASLISRHNGSVGMGRHKF